MAHKRKLAWKAVPLTRDGKVAAHVLLLTADDLADRLLRLCNGNAVAAHDAVTRAVARAKRPRGKPSKGTLFWLCVAADIKQDTGCSRRHAVEQAAMMADVPPRRLEDALGKTPLAVFRRRFQMVRSPG